MFAISTADVAMPAASVTAVFTPPAKLALAPVAGTLKVTVTFGTGFPPESLTMAVSFAANASPLSCSVWFRQRL